MVGMCEGQDDAQLVTRLIDQVFTSANKTPANIGEASNDPPDSSAGPSSVHPLQLQGLVNFMCSSSAASSLLAVQGGQVMAPNRAPPSTELSSPLPAKYSSRLAKDSKASQVGLNLLTLSLIQPVSSLLIRFLLLLFKRTPRLLPRALHSLLPSRAPSSTPACPALPQQPSSIPLLAR